jgi:hypothetical protein
VARESGHSERREHSGMRVLLSVQVARPERLAVLLVMRRSGVRFPKAAPRSAAPSDHGRGIFANTFANSATRCCAVHGPRVVRGGGLWGVHGLGKDVGRSGLGGADHMGVHAKGDRRVGVARRAATTCTGTPDSSKVVAWRCRRSCSRACGSWSFGRGPFSGSLWARMNLVIRELTVSG